MDIFATRRHQLTEIVGHYAHGNISVFAERFGYSRAQISQYLSETYNDGRSMGERAARALEKKIGLDQGYLDEPPYVTRVDADTNPAPTPNPEGKVKARFLVSATKEMKGFVDLVPAPEDSHKTSVFLEIPFASKEAFALAVFGSGLRPRAKSGEFLLVDPAITPSPGDDVFLKLASLESDQSPFLVMQLLYSKGDEVTFGSLNENGPSMTVRSKDILRMEPIIAILGVRNWGD